MHGSLAHVGAQLPVENDLCDMVVRARGALLVCKTTVGKFDTYCYHKVSVYN